MTNFPISFLAEEKLVSVKLGDTKTWQFERGADATTKIVVSDDVWFELIYTEGEEPALLVGANVKGYEALACQVDRTDGGIAYLGVTYSDDGGTNYKEPITTYDSNGSGYLFVLDAA